MFYTDGIYDPQHEYDTYQSKQDDSQVLLSSHKNADNIKFPSTSYFSIKFHAGDQVMETKSKR